MRRFLVSFLGSCLGAMCGACLVAALSFFAMADLVGRDRYPPTAKPPPWQRALMADQPPPVPQVVEKAIPKSP